MRKVRMVKSLVITILFFLFLYLLTIGLNYIVNNGWEKELFIGVMSLWIFGFCWAVFYSLFKSIEEE